VPKIAGFADDCVLGVVKVGATGLGLLGVKGVGIFILPVEVVILPVVSLL
jgi:hypothetical protein